MVARSLQVVIYREGDGFVAQCLNVDVASDGDTEDQARDNIREALELYFDEPDAVAAWTPVHQRGSHAKWRRTSSDPRDPTRTVIVPMGRQHLAIGTFRSICRQAGLQPED
jgi:predicted RNA binding protein YcfA (HicA-like mRNA interferase family)